MDIRASLDRTLKEATALARQYGSASVTFTEFTIDNRGTGVWSGRSYEKMANVLMTTNPRKNLTLMGEKLFANWLPMGAWCLLGQTVVYRASWPFTTENLCGSLAQHVRSLGFALAEELTDDERGNHRRNLRWASCASVRCKTRVGFRARSPIARNRHWAHRQEEY